MFSSSDYNRKQTFKLYSNTNKTLNEFSSISTKNGGYRISISTEPFINYSLKTISTCFILNYYEDLCKEWKYTYERTATSFKIIW